MNTSCNSDSSCTSCGQGLNYFLLSTSSGATCEECPEITSCIQCDSVNTYKCSLCRKGYYINKNGTCSNCSENCTECKSSRVCTGCVPGYYMKDGLSEGSCPKCQSPCSICQG